MEAHTVTKLFAGPFVGEFGWELFCFQGHLRWLKRANPSIDITVCARPGHEALYQDFAHNFVAFTPPIGQPDCFRIHGQESSDYAFLVPSGSKWLNPYGLPFGRSQGVPTLPNQEFLQYGNATKYKYDVLIHARARRTCPERNWSADNWQALFASFPSEWSVGWIGTEEEASMYSLDSTNDLRGLPLDQLINEIRAARVVIGPSSGPMHLAALCGVPHVVWSGNVRDVPRYREVWNPFNVAHTMLSTWQPKVDVVQMAVESYIE